MRLFKAMLEIISYLQICKWLRELLGGLPVKLLQILSAVKIIVTNVSVAFTVALTEAPLNQECLIGLKL